MSSDNTINNIDACIELAKRFIKRAAAARRVLGKGGSVSITGSPDTAGMLRASLDLTRGLADLRVDDHIVNNERVSRKASRWL